MHIVLYIAVMALFIAYKTGVSEAVSVMIGFGIVWACYRFAARSAIPMESFKICLVSLIKITVYRVVLAGLVISALFKLKHVIPQLPLQPVYVVLGFLVSIVIYRFKVVLVGAKNV